LRGIAYTFEVVDIPDCMEVLLMQMPSVSSHTYEKQIQLVIWTKRLSTHT